MAKCEGAAVGVWCKWIFPIVRIVVFAVIGIALVKLAFFSAATTTPDAAVPTGQLTQPQVAVTTGSITNDVTVKGTVSGDPAVPVKATLAGDVLKLSATQGQQVDAGTVLMTLRQQTPNPDGTTSTKTIVVKSPIAGVLTSLPVLATQTVNVGDVVAQVSPPTFSVSGSLDPAAQYRLLNQPTEAAVTITGGPAPFNCTGLTITAPQLDASGASGASGAAAGAAGGSTDTTVRCAVPATVKVFSGLAATMTISGGSTQNALIVPVTAVEGGSGSGEVYLVAAGASPKKTAVTLGLSDGTHVEVTGGLKAGDQVLEFVPGAAGKASAESSSCVTSGNTTACGG